MNLRETTVGVIGGGTVGKAIARAYLEFTAGVRVFDVREERRTASLESTLGSDYVFVALPTPAPELPGGPALDLSALETFFGTVRGSEKVFILRSTVPIGTTRRLAGEYGLKNLVYSPEFLTARCAITDVNLPAQNVIGGIGYPASSSLRNFYAARFPGAPTLLLTAEEAEALKLILNAFFAVKVSFFNEANRLVEALGLNWMRVLRGVLGDGRVGLHHTSVPGPDGKFGFGGGCLPKDAEAFARELESLRLPSTVVRGALDRNPVDRERG